MLFMFHVRLILGCALVHSMGKGSQVHAPQPHDKQLHVGAYEKLVIDTSSLMATHTDSSVEETGIVMTSREGITEISGQNFTYQVAELEYEGDITFGSGSRVSIKGNRSLSIQSKDGNINIKTDLNLTCGNDSLSNETCLGGYSVKYTTFQIFKGVGPGWKNYDNKQLQSLIATGQRCVPGAAHGGIGGISNKYNGDVYPVAVAATYGKNDFKAMLGGSGGFSNTKPFFYGGGAIELIAKKGKINIDASISANAVNGYQEDKDDAFSGSSGGLIRLIAREVKMTKTSSLNVNGGNANGAIVYGTKMKGNGGGSGGVIQINATKGIIYNVSLSGGQSNCTDEEQSKPAENGFLVIKGYYETDNSSWIESYQWPNETGQSTNKTKDELLLLSKELTQIKEKLNDNISAEDLRNLILNNLYRLMNFSTVHNITKKELLTFVQIFENYTEIIDKILSQNMPLDIQEVYGLLLKLASVVMATNNQNNWKELERLPYFVSLLETMAISISVKSTLNYQSDTIIVQSNPFNADDTEGYKFPVRSKLPSDSFITQQDFVYIPRTSLSNPSEEYKYIILFFKDIQDGLPESSQQSKESTPLFKAASLLMSCSLLHNGSLVTKIPSPAFLHFALNKREGTYEVKAQCSFWDTKNNSWDEEGVTLKELQLTNSSSICTTTHFTSFAVLMQHTHIKMTQKEELSLLLITYIGCGISIGSLLIALIVFLSVEGLTSERHRIHLNLVIALLLAQILFLTGIKATEHDILCKVIAGSLHYFFMASFTWMLIEGVHLYLKVVKVFGIENIKAKQYCILGWGIPALIVGVAAIFKPLHYSTKYVCWLSMDDGFVWAFIGPVVAIIAINFVILVVVIKTVVTSASTMKSSEHSHIKAGIKGALVLMPLMGITWIFGLMAVNRDSLVFQYLFSIANSFQGLFIFLLHIVFNNEVRLAFKRQREKMQLSKESGDYNASITYSNESKSWAEKESSPSSNTVKSGLGRLKARLSMSVMPRTSRVVSVQPIKSIDDEVTVNRKYCNTGASNNLSARLHCPKEPDSEPKPPHHNPLRSDFKTSPKLYKR